MKKISLILVFVMLFAMFASCTAKKDDEKPNPITDDEVISEQKADISVHALKGPTGIGMAKLMSDNEAGNAQNNYSFTIASSPDEISAAVISGNFDIAAVPSNLASVLFKKTDGNVQVVAVNTLGVLHVIENGSTINSVEDLRGKHIYATGQGSTPEYILNYILSKNGIDPASDVEITYLSEHSELAAQMTSGDIEIGVLPEPNVSSVLMNNSDARLALDLTKEWDKVSPDDSALIQGVVVVNKKFADANPDALNKFLDEYKNSIEYVTSNVDDASVLVEKYGIIPKAAIAKKAIPNCNIKFISGDDMKNALSGFLSILFDANPSSVGGALPADDFYYAAK